MQGNACASRRGNESSWNISSLGQVQNGSNIKSYEGLVYKNAITKKTKQKLEVQSACVPHVSVTLPVVLNVIGGHGGVGDSIVHDSVHRHRDWVTGEDLHGRPGLISAKYSLQEWYLRQNSWKKSRQKSLLFTVTSTALPWAWDFYFFKLTQPLTVSAVQWLYTVKEKGVKPDRKLRKPYPPSLRFKKSIQKPQVWELSTSQGYARKSAPPYLSNNARVSLSKCKLLEVTTNGGRPLVWFLSLPEGVLQPHVYTVQTRVQRFFLVFSVQDCTLSLIYLHSIYSIEGIPPRLKLQELMYTVDTMLNSTSISYRRSILTS